MVYESPNSCESFENENESLSSLVFNDIETDKTSQSYTLENQNWSWSYMQKQLRVRNLESLYSSYRQVLHQGCFSIFFLLQILFTLIHVGCLLIEEIDDEQHKTIPDIVSYIAITFLFWPMIAILLKKNLLKKHLFLPHTVSCFAVAIVVIVDIALPVYHTSVFHSRIPLRPAYASHALLACYIILPLTNNITPIILGIGITLAHIFTLATVTYRNSTNANKQMFSEIIFYFCINVMGIYYRVIREMVIRRAFLDKRGCVEFTLKLNHEKEQEEQLLLSILPWHISVRVKEDIRKKAQQSDFVEKPIASTLSEELYLERHDSVSVLYADMVNYTKMTSSLPVNKLVETLNELFGKFDEASERHNVLRIKFLGDCYCCASGIPNPNPRHAENCVDLGLDMIAIIKEVRQKRKLSIDMRIGVHSGSILSGLIGRCKWQYDIWSKDVIIANRMEQSGEPGMVHITKQTLDLLNGSYAIQPGNGHLKDNLLNKYRIQTFLIKPQEEEIFEVKSGIFYKRESLGPNKSKTDKIHLKHGSDPMYGLRGVISGEGAMALSRRRTAFMSNNIILYQQRLKMADIYMEKAINNLPAGCYQFPFQYDSIHPFCLTFRDQCREEFHVLKQPDPLFKFYLMSALFVSICLLAMHFWEFERLSLITRVSFGVSIFGLISLLPFTWSHYVWNVFKDPKQQKKCILKPENKFLLFLYKSSVKIMWNGKLRTFLYIIVCLLLTLCSLGNLISQLNELYYVYYFSNSTFSADDRVSEHGLWQMTESCYLVILTSFFFIRIYFQLKLLIGILIFILYSCEVLVHSDLIFQNNETWNPNMEPKVAHLLSIVFLVIELHLMDRRIECIDRLDYLWKRQLVDEKDEVEKTRSINLKLLHNILPRHVAKVYLNINRNSNDHYHEYYECVSVMFASLMNYDQYQDSNVFCSEIKSLEILNKIICDFDDALFENRFKTVEKIKLAGLTYIAACGLHPGQGYTDNSSKLNSTKMIIVMLEFATSILNRLEKINREFKTDFKLRIGISHGPVTAGVVGSQKPLYDIWGDTVNIASRMDSTGVPGKIQVTHSTALILREENISCSYRGPTYVKGKGVIDTYFVKSR